MNQPQQKSFLVFSGGNDRAVLGFLRALRLCGERAHIVARTGDDRILKTNFRRDVKFVRATHELSLEVFSQCVRTVRAGIGDVTLAVLPSTEYFNTFLLRHRREIEAMDCEIPLPDAALYARLTEKRNAADFFSAAGINVPREISGAGVFDPPVVAKPFRNVSANGQSLYPHLLQTRADIDAFLASHDLSEFFFQEYVRGDSLYLLLHLSRTGDSDVTWSQRNLLQQSGGKSMLLAEPSDFHDSETAAHIIRALHTTGFNGLGMVEVIRTPEKDVFIEMNPRIWGPVQFCVDQARPLLQAFIGETLRADAAAFIDRGERVRRGRYFWLGGVLESRRGGQPLAWHAPKRPMFSVILRNLFCDVYLRADSWRCFLHDLRQYFQVRAKR